MDEEVDEDVDEDVDEEVATCTFSSSCPWSVGTG